MIGEKAEKGRFLVVESDNLREGEASFRVAYQKNRDGTPCWGKKRHDLITTSESCHIYHRRGGKGSCKERRKGGSRINGAVSRVLPFRS